MSSEPLTLEIGKKLSPSEAKAFTDQIKQRMYALWNEKIFAGAFMRDLEAGKLPLAERGTRARGRRRARLQARWRPKGGDHCGW